MPAKIGNVRKFELWRWQVFAITWLAYASYYFTRKAFSVAKLGIAEDGSLGLAVETMANADGILLATYAVGQFCWGTLADRFGPRIVVLGGLALSAAAAFVIGLFPAAIVFLIFSGIQGLAQSTGWASLCKNMANFFSTRERGRIMGFWCTNYTIGGLVAAPFSGWVAYTLFDDWRWAMFAPALVVLVVLVLFFIFQRNQPEDVGLPSIQTYHAEPEPLVDGITMKKIEKERESFRGFIHVTGEILRNRTILLLAFVYFLLKPARYAILFWGPFIVHQQQENVGLVAAATIPVAFELAGIFGPIVIGVASDRWFGSRRIPLCAISLFLLVIFLLAFVPMIRMGGWVTVLGFFMIGLTLYGPDSMISSSAAMDFGSVTGAGTATGFVNGCGSIGAVAGGVLPGYFEIEHVFYSFAMFNFVAALVLLPWWNKMPETEKNRK